MCVFGCFALGCFLRLPEASVLFLHYNKPTVKTVYLLFLFGGFFQSALRRAFLAIVTFFETLRKLLWCLVYGSRFLLRHVWFRLPCNEVWTNVSFVNITYLKVVTVAANDSNLTQVRRDRKMVLPSGALAARML